MAKRTLKQMADAPLFTPRQLTYMLGGLLGLLVFIWQARPYYDKFIEYDERIMFIETTLGIRRTAGNVPTQP